MYPEQSSYERLFFALWPGDSVRRQLIQRFKRVRGIQDQGRLISPDNLHMTLHFLGNIELDRIHCFIRQARSVTVNPFDLYINYAGYFKKPRVVWFGCENIPAQLTQLHQDLKKVLLNCGYHSEQRKYNPHVTMARKIPNAVTEQFIEPVKWKVDEFVLVKSITHSSTVQYLVRDKFGQ